MPCTPDVVYEALSWIHTLQTSPGRDLHSALALAFSDPVCQSVHLVTSGLPDNPPQCLASLSTLVMRPVNTFYIPDKTPMNTDISDFLQCITSTTRGSCYVMTLNSSGNVDQVKCWMFVWCPPLILFILWSPFNVLKWNSLVCCIQRMTWFKSHHTLRTHAIQWTSIMSHSTTAQAVSVPYHAGMFFNLISNWKERK